MHSFQTAQQTIKAIVVQLGNGFAVCSPCHADGGRPGWLVKIRPEFHRACQLDTRANHGVGFGGKVSPSRPVKAGDEVYLVVHPSGNVAEAWTYASEPVATKSEPIKVIATLVSVVATVTPKAEETKALIVAPLRKPTGGLTYAARRAAKRAAEFREHSQNDATNRVLVTA